MVNFLGLILWLLSSQIVLCKLDSYFLMFLLYVFIENVDKSILLDRFLFHTNVFKISISMSAVKNSLFTDCFDLTFLASIFSVLNVF